MATIAEMLVGSTLEAANKAPDISGAMVKGAQLAQAAQNVEAQRAELEMRKQEHYIGKINRVMDAIEKGSGFKDKAAQGMYFKNYLPGMVKALKLEEFFTPETMQFVQGSPEVRDKLLGLRLDMQDKISNGQLRGAAILDYAKSKLNPEELAMLDTDSLIEQQKFAMSEAGKTERAEMVQTGQGQRQRTQIGSAGQTALAQDVAKRYSDYKAGGGRAGMEASLKKLEGAAAALKTGKVKTGGVTTVIPGFKSDTAQSVLNPQMVAVKTDAQAALNTILRSTLGAQFTAQEGERVLNQIWDDRQPPAENARRIKEKIEELRNNARNAESEFQRFGYLQESGIADKGKKAKATQVSAPAEWQSKLNSQIDRVTKLAPEEYNKYVNAFANKYNLSVDQVKKALGK